MREGYKQCETCKIVRNTALAPICPICLDVKNREFFKEKYAVKRKRPKGGICQYCQKELSGEKISCFTCKRENAKKRELQRLKEKLGGSAYN